MQENKIFSEDEQSIAQNFNNHEVYDNNAVLDCRQALDEDLHPVPCEAIEIAVAAVERGKSFGIDNIPA